ncbi:YesL family protein [Domibacillus sp. A3M-37]|uniref:YesL family protein n=1 Tax=Domibacillus sp. A3M-37 TaxID=2962037 RepID=UPI0020B73AB0|nr:YesL family protein [Domibacillus sp. A3M-37]MCP3763469.1 YesL family protein [Domibacillus sp. A3M-37]
MWTSNSKLYNFIDIITNLFQLSILWMIFSLPVVTIFPATAAMYCVVRHWILYEDISVYRSFILFFKDNFKKSFIIGLIWLAVATFIYLDYLAVLHFQFAKPLFFSVLTGFTLLGLGFTLFLFPVMANFDGPIKITLKNTFLFTVGKLPITFFMVILTATAIGIIVTAPITSFFIISTAAYLMYRMCHKTFEQIKKQAN